MNCADGDLIQCDDGSHIAVITDAVLQYEPTDHHIAQQEIAAVLVPNAERLRVSMRRLIRSRPYCPVTGLPLGDIYMIWRPRRMVYGRWWCSTCSGGMPEGAV